ncbi:hypothetical protein [Paucihalobacter sp.]|uniref:hypothetical protein n=1 Tax=Paucihalobacter sp. TaxID=2850405 RepID=UPI002FE3BBA3
MKKRHEQKLVILAIALLVAFNIPMIYIFDIDAAIFGIPVLYAFIFIIWLLAIVISYIILNRHYE